MTPTRIRWEPTEYGGWTGHVGTMEPWAFQIWQVDGPDSPWRLDSALLGQFGRHLDNGKPGILKTEAEGWLAEFTSSLGAIFPESVRTEWGVRLHPDRPDLIWLTGDGEGHAEAARNLAAWCGQHGELHALACRTVTYGPWGAPRPEGETGR